MEFSDYPTEERKTNLKHIVIIVVGIVVAVVAVFIVVRVLNKQETPETAIDKIVNNQLQAVRAQCADSEDEQTCLRSTVAPLVRTTGRVEFCEGLTGEDYDGCVWVSAKKSENAQLCLSIVYDTTRALCNDGVYGSLAHKSKDSSLCDKIVDESKRVACKRSFEPTKTAENCESLGGSEEECFELNVVKLATEKQDREICKRLDERLIDACVDVVFIDDPDFDGLDSGQEKVYGSDPRIADTDGDGYSDGGEVSNGYNPNGTGRL